MRNSFFLSLYNHWSALALTGLVIVLLSGLSVDLYFTWQQSPPYQEKTDPWPMPPLPKKTISEDVDTGCKVIDGVSICDKPVSLTPLCALHGKHHKHPNFSYTKKLKPPRAEAVKALKWMTDEVGISANFELLAGEFTETVVAFAAIRKEKRYIVYDEAMIFLAPDGQVYWRTLGVLAHELGHHLAAHTSVRNQTSHARELEADRFAGQMLGKLGATQLQAVSWMAMLSEEGSATHPPRAKRMKAALDGWYQHQRLMAE